MRVFILLYGVLISVMDPMLPLVYILDGRH